MDHGIHIRWPCNFGTVKCSMLGRADIFVCLKLGYPKTSVLIIVPIKIAILGVPPNFWTSPLNSSVCQWIPHFNWFRSHVNLWLLVQSQFTLVTYQSPCLSPESLSYLNSLLRRSQKDRFLWTSNKYWKVVFKIPKKGHLSNPELDSKNKVNFLNNSSKGKSYEMLWLWVTNLLYLTGKSPWTAR